MTRIIWTILFVSMAAIAGNSQTFEVTPSSTLELNNLEINLESIHDIFQLNTSAETTTMAWEKLVVDIPADWSYTFCDLGTCYVTMPDQAIMAQEIAPGESSFVGLTLNPASEGSGSFQVRVWDTAAPEYSVICTWLFSTGLIAVVEKSLPDFQFFPNPTHHLLNVILPVDHTLDRGVVILKDMSGRVVWRRLVFVSQKLQFDVSDLASGLYLLIVSDQKDFYSAKKVLIE